MKKLLLVGILSVALVGCGGQEDYETLGNIHVEQPTAAAWEIAVDLPAEIASPVMETEQLCKLYMCDTYTLSTCTVDSGDLNRTFTQCTGFDAESLAVMKTETNGWKRYEAVWSAASEDGDQMGRIAVLDDGTYHYVLTAMSHANDVGTLAEVWQPVFRSFRIVEPGSQINTGS